MKPSGKGPATFDFLGFTMYWKRTRWGRWRMQCKTRRARLARAIVTIGAWCRRHRHQPIKAQHAALKRRIQGHINYFGVSGNFERLMLVVEEAKRCWFKRLQRSSQQGTSPGSDSAKFSAIRSRVPGSPSKSGRRPDRKTPRRKRGMVEISLSGSGEGAGGGKAPGATGQGSPVQANRCERFTYLGCDARQ